MFNYNDCFEKGDVFYKITRYLKENQRSRQVYYSKTSLIAIQKVKHEESISTFLKYEIIVASVDPTIMTSLF